MSAEVITLTGMCGVACWELTSAPRRESARFLLPIASFYIATSVPRLAMGRDWTSSRLHVCPVISAPSCAANRCRQRDETVLGNSLTSGVQSYTKARNRTRHDMRAAIAGRRLPCLH